MLKFIIILLCASHLYCLSCPSNEYKYNTQDTTVCMPCAKNLQSCSATYKCFEGFYQSYSSAESKTTECKSDETKLANCLKKISGTETCQECEEGYWKNDALKCIKKTSTFIQKCKTWKEGAGITTEQCSAANSGFYVTDAGEFITCFAHCSKCTTAEDCTECVNGYHFGDESKSCVSNTGNCLTWKIQTDEECLSCKAGYTKKKNMCYNSLCTCQDGKGPQYPDCSISCTDQNCKTCSAAATCTKCKDTFFVKEDDNTCASCQTGCITCTSASVCSVCSDGYFLEGSTCTACASGCLKCLAGKCALCEPPKVIKGTGCVELDPVVENCRKTDDSELKVCSKCLGGYFMGDNVCTSCGNNCQVCESASACQICLGGYYLSDGSCVQCSLSHCSTCSSATYCDTCEAGYLIHKKGNTQNECIQCTEAYAKYQDKTCKSNQWIKSPWTCTDLTENCAVAKTYQDYGTNVQFCQTCASGYRIKDDACEKCQITNCKDCSEAADTCESCLNGYYKESSLKCTLCLDNCDYCEAKSICLDCETGYAFSEALNECIKCSDANCDWCSSSNTCVKCKNAYYLNSSSQCAACLSTCTKCYDATSCYECKDTYFLKEYGCYSCIQKCSKCVNDKTCTTCIEGFIPNFSYTECMNATLCLGNSPNCKACDTQDTVHCYECNDYYYLDDKLCKSCLENCQTCLTGDKCKKCKEGYQLNTDSTNCTEITINEASCYSVIDGCIQCNPENLLKCGFCAQGSVPKEDGTCVCDSGYKLISGQCQKQYTLTIDFDSLSSVEIETLQTYVEQTTYGTKKANNTEKVLKQLKSKLTTIDSTTGQQAAGLLLSLSSTSTNLVAQNYYKDILKGICSTAGLDNSVYYTALAATDSFYSISNQTMRQTVYEYGFTDCIKNYLKKASPSEISLLKLTNSQLLIKEISIKDNGNTDQTMAFSDSSVVATIDLKVYLQALSATKKYYMVTQSISNTANPYKYTQNSTVLFESKIISVTVMSKTGEDDTNAPSVVDISMTGKTFNVTFDFEGGQCGHYDEDKLAWKLDGNSTGKTCQFNHTTHFAMFEQALDVVISAYIMTILSVFWIGLLLLI